MTIRRLSQGTLTISLYPIREITDRDGNRLASYCRRAQQEHQLRRARVRAALSAAAERTRNPFVRAARRALAERFARVRFCAAERACCDKAFRAAAALPSRFSASSVAVDRRAELWRFPLRPNS